MNNKKGFTLVEIAIVVAVIGLLSIAIVPKIADIFGDSITKTMKVQENNVRDAAVMYLEDHCANPISGFRCTLTRNSDNTYSGTIDLATLISEEYIDDVSIQGINCLGEIRLDHGEATVCLECEDVYTTSCPAVVNSSSV